MGATCAPGASRCGRGRGRRGQWIPRKGQHAAQLPRATMPTLENVKAVADPVCQHGRGLRDRKASSAIRTSMWSLARIAAANRAAFFGACGADGEGGHGNPARHLRNG